MSYLNEAFKELDELEDEVDLQNEEDVKKALDFLKGDADNTDHLEMVVDIDADEEDELQDSYVGEILLMCPACHTLHYAHEDDIVPSEDETSDFVNVGEPCPHCKQEDGFEIKGKVAEYVPEGEESKEDEDDSIDNFDDLDDIEDEETEEEKLQFEESVKRRKQYVDSVAEDNLDDLARLTGIELPMTKKVVAPKTKSLNENLTEAPLYDLKPQYDARQSFYNKATVDTGDKGDKNKLYSYNTLVAEMKDGKPVVYGTFSQTTLRHIKEWLKQNGFKAENSKQIMADYGAKRESCKEAIETSLLDMFKDSYTTEHKMDDKYTLFLEGLTENNEGCDAVYDNFDKANIKGVLVEVVDNEGEAIKSLGSFPVDTKIDEVIVKANESLKESKVDDIDAQADNKKEVAKKEFEKKIDDADADRDDKLDEAHYNDKTGEVEPDYFYGVEGVEFIDHGAWADPEVSYNGKTYNYYALEDTLYDDFKDRVASGEIIINTDGYEDLPRGSKEEQAEMDAFENFVTENKDLVFEILDGLDPVEESMTEGCHKEEKKEQSPKVTESAHKIVVNGDKITIDDDTYDLLDSNDTYYLFKDKNGVQEIRKDGKFDDEYYFGDSEIEEGCHTKEAKKVTIEESARKVTLEDGKVYVNGELKEGLIRVKHDDAWYIVDEDTDEEIDGPFDTLKDTEDYGYGNLEYIAPRTDEAVEKKEEPCEGDNCEKKEKESTKSLKESAIDVYQDILERAKSNIKDGYSNIDDAIWSALDDGLIYTDDEFEVLKDIFSCDDLYTEYGENVRQYIDEKVFNEIYGDVKDYFEQEVKREQDEFDNSEDEFEESLFENLVNRYCSRVYENVDNYKATACSREGKNFIVEGMLTYKNGKQEPTKFTFVENKGVNDIIKYVGLNETFSNNKKAFTLNLTKDGNKLLSESLYYNYNTKVDNKNYSVKGKVATPKRK